jgi:hypothetical protein
MALMANAKSSGFPPFKAGTYQAVCYSVIDLGTQYSDLYGKEQHKVWIAFEIPSIRCEVDGEDKPRVVSKFYTLSIHEKSNLGIHLVGWRGKEFTAEEANGFNIMALMGKNCLLNVGVKEKKNGDSRNEINSIAKLMDGMEELKPETPMCQYSISACGWDFPENMPEGIQKIIEKSMEFKASQAASENAELRAAQQELGEPEPEDTTDFDREEDIPF